MSLLLLFNNFSQDTSGGSGRKRGRELRRPRENDKVIEDDMDFMELIEMVFPIIIG